MKKSTLILAVVAVALAAMLSSTALAVDLVVFQTTGVTAGTDISDSPASVDPSVSSSDLALNVPNVVPLGSAWAGALSMGGVDNFGGNNLDLAAAINGEGILDGNGTDGGDYATVTVTPNSPINFTNFHLNIASNVTGSQGPQNIDLLSSLTGFTAADSLGTFNPADPGGFANDGHDFDLSGVAGLQGVNVPVEFRIYVSDIGNRISIGHVFNGGAITDDVVISGTVVPEPATLALLGIGAVASLATRRRK